MNRKEIDSEVLRILIGVLETNAEDEEVGEHGREDAKWWLEMIGKTFIEVTGWSKYNVEKGKEYEFGVSNLSMVMDDVLDE